MSKINFRHLGLAVPGPDGGFAADLFGDASGQPG